jgi:molybdopterin converting factor subunit 1
MIVQVKLFAAAKQAAGTDSVTVDIMEPPTVEGLRRALAAQFPPLARLLNHALFAVNTEYVSPQTTISPDDEIACIPPVSGG